MEEHWCAVSNWWRMCLSQNPCVEALPSRVMVFGNGLGHSNKPQLREKTTFVKGDHACSIIEQLIIFI